VTVLTATLDSPLGPLRVLSEDDRVIGVYFPDHRRGPEVADHWVEAAAVFASLAEQLDAYFRGDRRTFDVPLHLEGSTFQRQVWELLRHVRYGETVTYGELAAATGHPSAARAVASAVARNPISIVVPCHRVLGAGGTLTGYAGGLERKRWLLELESRVVRSANASPTLFGP
jgi:methylated-DNA-[protein]-cysteine S-methyltransferase